MRIRPVAQIVAVKTGESSKMQASRLLIVAKASAARTLTAESRIEGIYLGDHLACAPAASD
jgi:hypothetical protein